MKFNTIKITETTSTNTELKHMASRGAEVGTVLVAQRQTGGRGRLERNFSSQEGGLYMSIIFPFERGENVGTLTCGAAVAVSRAVERLADVETRIKWVNDVCVGGRKVCGILAEAVTCGGDVKAVLGIGVNLTNELPRELADVATTLFDECGKAFLPEQLLPLVLEELSALENLKKQEIIEEYRHRCLTIGKKTVVIPHNGEKYEATALEILDDGSLLVQKDDGATVRIFSGEVSTRLAEVKNER